MTTQAELMLAAFCAPRATRPKKPRYQYMQIGTVVHVYMKGGRQVRKEVPLIGAAKIDRSRYTPEKLRQIRANGKNR